jgi:hypothetical protein
MNWGHKLLLVFLAFAAGMFYLVYRSMHVNYELVSKEYYKDEIHYQDVIDASKRADALSSKADISQSNHAIRLKLPSEMKAGNVSGSIWFYCANDETKDRHVSIQLDDQAAQVISKQKFLPGNYVVKVDWQSNNVRYHAEEPLTIL